MYGDYEAQRHWMEVTLNLKVKDWYENSTDNDLGYWGIDYPPLSAYQSWICGKFVALFDPQSVELHSSRGFENGPSKLGMRLSVLASDMVVYIPACVVWSSTIHKKSSRLLVLLWMICNPALLIIDHGHFQYNSISLGLTVASIYCIVSNRYVRGAFLFCAALNHKQMTLYFAPAIFSHLLGVCMQQKGLAGKVKMLLKLGVTVLGSFSFLWLPYLRDYNTFIQVLKRVFPMQRGLFEDYVANFWCVSSLVFKWKKYLTGGVLAKLCAVATMLFSSPALFMQATKPQNETFILCLANTSLAFFLFSYQVHEKSILIPLVPLSMLLSQEGKVPNINIFMISLLTMYPLLKKDGLKVVYWAMQLLIIGIECITRKEMISKNFISFFGGLSPLLALSGVCLVHAFCYFIQPWSCKEYLSDAVMMLVGFGFISAQLITTNIKHFSFWRSQKLNGR
jgi:alpha-1,3-glucosyltransferase